MNHCCCYSPPMNHWCGPGNTDDSSVRVGGSARLPAALAPFVEVGTLGPQPRVASVTGIDPGLVRQAVEQLARHVVDQRREVLLRAERVADAAGEQAVAGE